MKLNYKFQFKRKNDFHRKKKQGLKLKKQRSTGDLEKRGNASGSIRSTISTASWISTGSSQSAVSNKYEHKQFILMLIPLSFDA